MRPECIRPISRRGQFDQALGDVRGEEQAFLFDPEAGVAKTFAVQDGGEEVSRVLGVRMPREPGVSHLIGDGRPFHRPRRDQRFAVQRHDQYVASEETPMVEAGDVIYVLGHGDDQAVQPPFGHELADGSQTQFQFLGGKRFVGDVPISVEIRGAGVAG